MAGHLTASAVVLDGDGRTVLLTLHPRVGRWLQLGGHCEDGDSTLAGAALREATEESGIDGLELVGPPVHLDVHPITCSLGVPTRHFDVRYLVVAPPGAVARISAESDDLRFWPVDGLPADTDTSTRAGRRRRTDVQPEQSRQPLNWSRQPLNWSREPLRRSREPLRRSRERHGGSAREPHLEAVAGDHVVAARRQRRRVETDLDLVVEEHESQPVRRSGAGRVELVDEPDRVVRAGVQLVGGQVVEEVDTPVVAGDARSSHAPAPRR